MKDIRKYISVFIIAIVFLLVGFLSQYYADFFDYLFNEYRSWGMVGYFFFTILAIVAAPLSSIPLIPLMVSVWGFFWTVLLSLAGWIIGSVIAFWIARRFGVPVVKKLASVEEEKDLLKNISDKKVFLVFIAFKGNSSSRHSKLCSGSFY